MCSPCRASRGQAGRRWLGRGGRGKGKGRGQDLVDLMGSRSCERGTTVGGSTPPGLGERAHARLLCRRPFAIVACALRCQEPWLHGKVVHSVTGNLQHMGKRKRPRAGALSREEHAPARGGLCALLVLFYYGRSLHEQTHTPSWHGRARRRARLRHVGVHDVVRDVGRLRSPQAVVLASNSND